jgi:hypothetical protein
MSSEDFYRRDLFGAKRLQYKIVMVEVVFVRKLLHAIVSYLISINFNFCHKKLKKQLKSGFAAYFFWKVSAFYESRKTVNPDKVFTYKMFQYFFYISTIFSAY